MSGPPQTLDFSHVGVYVYDLETMHEFYVRVLGFKVTDKGIARGRPIVFLSRNPDEHHQIVLAEGRTGERSDRVVNQISLRAGGLQDLRDLKETLEAEPNVSDIDPICHGNAWSVYFRDPEGNRIEVFVDSPWYCDQPMIEPLDLSMSDEEIAQATRDAIKDRPGFQPLESWKAEFADKLNAS
ncbi:MAG: VOC family protein [Bauldia litoralis]